MSLRTFEAMKNRLFRWSALKLPPCKDITRLLSDSMDRSLPLRQRILVQLHVCVCVWCERYRRQLFFMREAFRRYAEQGEDNKSSISPVLPPETCQRLKRVLRSHDR